MPRPSFTLRSLLCASAVAATALGTGALAAPKAPATGAPAAKTQFSLVKDRDVNDRLAQPEDRYAAAGGCYTIEAPGQGYLTENAGRLTLAKTAAAATPLHFQPTKLGEYLLATNRGRDTSVAGAWWDKRGYVAGATTDGVARGSGVAVADAPSEDAEWRLVAAGKKADAKNPKGQSYLLSVPARSAGLTVKDGVVSLQGAGTPVRLHHVADDNPRDTDVNGTRCASWPEISAGASGRPAAVQGKPSDKVKGFFEAHVHGMAFEFLGGELRCGRPWHKYGVEYALGDCKKENNPLNGVLEVPLGGNAPEYAATYDSVGWPTFKSWPKNRTLTHEQFYWRWLERAHAGGLRLLTNLLVDNSVLCQEYPIKRNSCNEMDSVRLQAKRLFELQDYIDAQYGGPGEGWLRIVTTPAQARQAINAGRLALVLGVEVSELFDCREVLDMPQCTTAEIDERLQEVFDMGVRQMELVNKFDNALSGVTGDNGTTGAVVNSGNRQVTGHYWDMQTCPKEAPHSHGDQEPGEQHDRTHSNVGDATPGDGEGVDALAGRVLDAFGGTTKGYVAPTYGPGPHCNSRGLTALGKHLIRAMVKKGMIFDPDHMSASAQREALDIIEDMETVETAKAKKEHRAAVLPAVMSSHSWANDVIYQRVYELDGVVAPRTDDAASFVKDWQRHRAWAAAQAPKGYDFGMGYGADTNGLGGQPGPRSKAKTRLDYSKPFTAPIGGVTLTQQKSGVRTFDINKEGVSEYGMFADWFQELRLAADEVKPGLGAQITSDMLNGAETYLGLWERAVYGGNSCVKDGSRLQVEDVHAALGRNMEGFLDAIGQPADRSDDAYVYCATTRSGKTVVLDVHFDAGGKAASVGPSRTSLAALGR
ncbi:MAG: hypothetical protein LC779_09505 [Actinobacteria bacterium]|nr:hypothetical protein [Actinomycetota bacterium]